MQSLLLVLGLLVLVYVGDRADVAEEVARIVEARSAGIDHPAIRAISDADFVARDGRVLKVRAAVPPWRMSAAIGAFAVVEFPAGALAASETKVGDTLALVPQ